MHDETRTPLIALALLAILLPAAPLRSQDHGPPPRPGAKILGDGQLLSLNDNGMAVGGAFTYDNGKQGSIVGPLGKGQNTNLLAVNNRGQILLAQKAGPLRYFIYDSGRKEYTPLGLAGQVTENGTPKAIQLAYLTGLDEQGRVYGVYGTKQGPCGVVGHPSAGTPGDLGPPPTAAATYDLIGCTGNGTVIRGMNGKGQITGSTHNQGFVWHDGQLSTFAFPGSSSTTGAAINDAGTIIGFFMPGYPISEEGVITPTRQPGMVIGTSYIYDGQQFRYVTMPHVTRSVTLTGINGRGQVVGWFDAGNGDKKGVVASPESFPVATMPSTVSELTAQAVDRKLSAPHSAGAGIDAAYRILQERIGQPPASTLRAIQALASIGPLPVKKRVEELDGSGMNYQYVSVEDLHGRRIRGLVGQLLSQLSQAQHTPAGIDATLDAVAALAGDDGLKDLRAAGELAPFGSGVLNSPSNQYTPAARAKFAATILAAISASVASHPLDMPPSDLGTWASKGASPQLLEQFDQTLRLIKTQLGAPTAAIFLAWSQARGADIGTMFGWEVVEQLVEMNTRGEQAHAEEVLRALAGTPAPAKCPGLDLLKASGGDKQDINMRVRNGANPRHDLADAIQGMGAQLLKTIDAKSSPAPAPAKTAAASAPQPAAAQAASSTPAPAPAPPPNAFASPTGPIFSGTGATFSDGSLTFTLKAPADSRNGQTMTFKGLFPLPDQKGPPKTWITQDANGYVVFSMLGSGVVMAQVIPGAGGKPLYDKARGAHAAP